MKGLDLLVRCYILGDELLDEDFQDAIIDVLIQVPTQWNAWPINETRNIFENTPATSALRTFVVDVVVHLDFSLCWNELDFPKKYQKGLQRRSAFPCR